MKKLTSVLFLGAATLAASAQPALTIYNQNFAVVRDTVPLDLKSGANPVIYSGATAQVEPDSVILRDAQASIPSKFSSKITAMTRYRRNCCSRSSRARRLIFRMSG
ncbi:MAG: hypothetical protein WDN00_02645 [Limisphaerales bacterium]